MFRSRSRRGYPVRYYLYVSDSKLDMLFDQIDLSVRKRINAEVKVDLRVASLTLRGADNPNPTRAAKLQIVERFIDTHCNVGTVEEPGLEYFRGQMDMQWGRIDPDAVWFQGNDYEHLQCVGLGGSGHHVLGAKPPEVYTSQSDLPAIMEILYDQYSFHSATALQEHVVAGDLPWHWDMFVDWKGDEAFLGFPQQRLEFLALPFKEIIAGMPDRHSVHVVIGTPLYVARARDF